MCRILCYLGKNEIPASKLLFDPDNSLIHQSYDPKLMSHIQNLAGFGMAAWSKNSLNPLEPFFYKTEQLPFFDKNLYALSRKISSNCLLAHVRGVGYATKEVVVQQNAHPFFYKNYTLALAHNGSLADIDLMKPLLMGHIKPGIIKNITGTTDSEWFYAVLMSQFRDPTANISLNETWDALYETFVIFRRVRETLGIEKASPANFFITNGEYLIVSRFVFDYGRCLHEVEKAFIQFHTLWYTYGKDFKYFDDDFMQKEKERTSVIFSSEPLTEDRTTWIALPEYSITKAWYDHDELKIRTYDLYV